MRRCLFAGVKHAEALLVSGAKGSSGGSRLSCICQRGLGHCSRYRTLVGMGVGRERIHSRIASEHWTSFALDSFPSHLQATARCPEAQAVAVGLKVSKLTCSGGMQSYQTANFDKQWETGMRRWAR